MYFVFVAIKPSARNISSESYTQVASVPIVYNAGIPLLLKAFIILYRTLMMSYHITYIV